MSNVPRGLLTAWNRLPIFLCDQILMSQCCVVLSFAGCW